ncbi:MAG: bifunctional precorrin-2 dehydrogenase/sirohydrochlorin ferrochelatase [Lachnospiraceae bacterium]|nr:bifunctional precorrin-2 dehydrogenase/sirohydrochlorin ferrochelatase [Lachnospiraceae bacterium]
MKQNKRYFPMFVDLTEKKVVVVGAGRIGSRRIRTLADFTDHLTVIAPEALPEVERLEEEGRLTWIRKSYERDLILDADLVLACTDDPELNSGIYSVCKCLGIQVNVCSDKNKCDFYFPGVITEESVVVGITASGTDHHQAKLVREKIEHALKDRND